MFYGNGCSVSQDPAVQLCTWAWRYVDVFGRRFRGEWGLGGTLTTRSFLLAAVTARLARVISFTVCLLAFVAASSASPAFFSRSTASFSSCSTAPEHTPDAALGAVVVRASCHHRRMEYALITCRLEGFRR